MSLADPPLRKYPRTPHLAGSRRQTGDEDLDDVPFAAVAGRVLTIEEKVDGANVGITFGTDGRLRLQSRGHVLAGGPQEIHFALFKRWASTHAAHFWSVLGSRYILYGEWLYAKHTIYYDALPHYFLEFDVLDTATELFLDTTRRQELLAGLPLCSVPVLKIGPVRKVAELAALIGTSAFITPGPDRWRCLRDACGTRGLDPERVIRETDPSALMEGVYVKVEEDGEVRARYKFVRADFLAAILGAGGHWLDRPILPNGLRSDADLFRDDPMPC